MYNPAMTTPAPSWVPLRHMDAAWDHMQAAGIAPSAHPSSSISVSIITQLTCLTRTQQVMWARVLSQMDALQDAFRAWSVQSALPVSDVTAWYDEIRDLAADLKRPSWMRFWKAAWPKRLGRVKRRAQEWVEALSETANRTARVHSALVSYEHALAALTSDVDALHASLAEDDTANRDRLTALATSLAALRAGSAHMSVRLRTHITLQDKVLRDAVVMGTANEQVIQSHSWGQS